MRFCSPKYKDGPFDEKNQLLDACRSIYRWNRACDTSFFIQDFLLKVLINLIKTLTLMNHSKIFYSRNGFHRLKDLNEVVISREIERQILKM